MFGLNIGATSIKVKAAYRKEALLWHPDKKTEDQARFVAIQEASEALTGLVPTIDDKRRVLMAPKIFRVVEEIETPSVDCPRAA